jgi:adenylate kinase family enzyme
MDTARAANANTTKDSGNAASYVDEARKFNGGDLDWLFDYRVEDAWDEGVLLFKLPPTVCHGTMDEF